MIPHSDHLLPESETPLNKALAAVSTRTDALKAPTREVWDPWRCPQDFLKVLAHAFSVDLWEDDWPETRKRSIIANAVRMHRAKGTLAGIQMYLSYSPGHLVKLVRPPQKVFSGPSLTRDEREAWLKQLPQVRVWRAWDKGTQGSKVFAGGYLHKSFFVTSFLQPSTAAERMRRRSRWVVGGVEQDVRVSDFGSFYRLHFKGSAGEKVFSNQKPGPRFFQPSDAAKRLVTIAPKERLPWRSPVWQTMTPVTAEPELVREKGKPNHGAFSNTIMRTGYLRPSTAWRRVFHRHAINDGRPLIRRPAIQFMGVGRYDFPKHTAHLRLSIPGQRHKLAAGEGIAARRSKFWMPHDGERTRKVRDALKSSKRNSDRLLYWTGWRPQIVAGGRPFLAGVHNFVVGKPTKEDVYGAES